MMHLFIFFPCTPTFEGAYSHTYTHSPWASVRRQQQRPHSSEERCEGQHRLQGWSENHSSHGGSSWQRELGKRGGCAEQGRLQAQRHTANHKSVSVNRGERSWTQEQGDKSQSKTCLHWAASKTSFTKTALSSVKKASLKICWSFELFPYAKNSFGYNIGFVCCCTMREATV